MVGVWIGGTVEEGVVEMVEEGAEDFNEGMIDTLVEGIVVVESVVGDSVVDDGVADDILLENVVMEDMVVDDRVVEDSIVENCMLDDSVAEDNSAEATLLDEAMPDDGITDEAVEDTLLETVIDPGTDDEIDTFDEKTSEAEEAGDDALLDEITLEDNDVRV